MLSPRDGDRQWVVAVANVGIECRQAAGTAKNRRTAPGPGEMYRCIDDRAVHDSCLETAGSIGTSSRRARRRTDPAWRQPFESRFPRFQIVTVGLVVRLQAKAG
jgi:hypothetical protein